MLIQFLADILLRSKDHIFDGALDASVAKLFRIDLRCISRQELDMNIRMHGKILFHQQAAMSMRTIPNHHKGCSDVATEMFQSSDQLFGIDGTIKMSLVDFACNGQA